MDRRKCPQVDAVAFVGIEVGDAVVARAGRVDKNVGAGLGHLFLRHLQRTHLLLHLVDFAPFDDSVDPVAQAKAIVAELKKYDQDLFDKPRWLVLNKMDMVPIEEREARVKDFVKRFKWKGPVFQISALTREGCEPLIHAIYKHVAKLKNVVPDDPDPRFTDTSAA